MFKDNKYNKWYQQIILSARNRDTIGYTEKHHIIPSCLGGTNSKDNLVELTAREHFIVHLLLIKMVEDKDVYRMVHAIIRFTDKVKNSKEYELLRKMVSTYSSGKYNISYGKIWVHDKNTNEISYIKREDYNDNYVLGLPYQRGGFNGYQWINNGVKEGLQPIELNVPNGWYKGRLTQASLEHLQYMSSKRHTKEKDLEHSKKLKGRVAVKNSHGEIKRIHLDNIEEYIKLGYIQIIPKRYIKKKKG